MSKKFLAGLFVVFVLSAIALSGMARIASAGALDATEQQILAATVRFEIESWRVRPDEKGYDIDDTVGHGTVMNGRYLVTHNHFDLPLSILQRPGDEGSYGIIYLYDSRGELRHKGPLADFYLAAGDAETLVFGHKVGRFFAELGFASAPFAAGSEVTLQPGMAAAQVDWDGRSSRVDWVSVEKVIVDGGLPRLVLADGVLPGASGGGVFIEGVHVANNWQLHERLGADGTLLQATTTAALNSPALLALP